MRTKQIAPHSVRHIRVMFRGTTCRTTEFGPKNRPYSPFFRSEPANQALPTKVFIVMHHQLCDTKHKPWSVSVLLCHAIQLHAQLLKKRLEVFETSVPQMMHQRPVRQNDIWFKLERNSKTTRRWHFVLKCTESSKCSEHASTVHS